MGLVRSIAELLRPAKQVETDPPLGLTEGELGILRDLGATEEWRVFQKAVDAQTNLYGEAMLHAGTTDNVHFMRGVVLGLRQAGMLIEQLLIADKERTENERRRSERKSWDPAAVATYGSEYFQRTSKQDATWRGTEIWRQ